MQLVKPNGAPTKHELVIDAGMLTFEKLSALMQSLLHVSPQFIVRVKCEIIMGRYETNKMIGEE